MLSVTSFVFLCVFSFNLDSISSDQLTEQLSCLTVSLSKEASKNIGKNNFSSKTSFPEGLKSPATDVQPLSIEDVDVESIDPDSRDDKKDKENFIVLSDDEKEPILPSDFLLSDTKTSHCVLDVETVAPNVDESTLPPDSMKKKGHAIDTSNDMSQPFQRKDATIVSGLTSQKVDYDKLRGKQTSVSLSKPEGSNQKDIIPKCASDYSRSQGHLKTSFNEAVSIKKLNKPCDNVFSKKGDTTLRERVFNAEDDPLESALDSVKRQPTLMERPNASVPKRQLIQLKTPIGNKHANLQRLGAREKRFKPPRLDEWYKPILEIDYFATVGLASVSEVDSHTVCKLKEVPVCFQSPEQYVAIFRPLVLEEFKAQLQSSFLEMSSLEDMYFGSLSVLSVERVDDFHLVRFSHDDSDSTSSRSFSENDLVLLTKEILQRPCHDVHMVGKVVLHTLSYIFLEVLGKKIFLCKIFPVPS